MDHGLVLASWVIVEGVVACRGKLLGCGQIHSPRVRQTWVRGGGPCVSSSGDAQWSVVEAGGRRRQLAEERAVMAAWCEAGVVCVMAPGTGPNGFSWETVIRGTAVWRRMAHGEGGGREWFGFLCQTIA